MIAPHRCGGSNRVERLRQVRTRDGRNRDQVGADECVEPVIRGEIDAPTDVRSGLPGSGPQTLKSKLGTPVGRAVDAEHLADDAELEGREAVQHQRRDTSNHGSILSYSDTAATVGGILAVE